MDQLSKLGFKVGTGSLIETFKSDFDAEKPHGDVVRKGSGFSPREVLQEQLSKGGIGMPVTTILSVPVDVISAERTKLPNVKSKPEYLKDTHGESHHTDNDKEVQDHQEEEEEIRLSLSPSDLWSKAFIDTDSTAQYLDKSFKHAPRPKKDASEKKLEHQQKKEAGLLTKKAEEVPAGVDKKEFKKIANLHENSPAVAEKKKSAVYKSDLEDAFDWIEKGFDYNKDGKLDAHEKDHKEETKTFEKFEQKLDAVKKEAPKKKPNFVKSAGPGGIVFDFGNMTGNPLADNATALLNANSDHIQAGIAGTQAKQIEKSLEDYVNMGENAFMANVNNGGNTNSNNLLDPHGRMNKGMDQQVKEAYERGEFNEGPVKNNTPYSVTKASLGGEVISATSETDAALIEMMKGQIEMENDPSVVSMKQSVTAGL